MQLSKEILNHRIDGKYTILKQQIGSGSFGCVYLGIDLTKNEGVAIKIEDSKTTTPQILYETKVLKIMKGKIGIPNVHYSGTLLGYNIMVFDILGPSLEDMFNLCSRKFSLKTVLMIFDQFMQRLETIHSKHYIHRDLKPDNFVLGLADKSNIIHAIDFGLCKKYRDPKTLQHIPYRENRSLTGTARFASINSHLGIEQSRRDDLESIAYICVYFLKGYLPWQGVKANTKQEKYNKIMEKKMSIPPEMLCKNLPHQFPIFMHYIKALKFDDKPDYMFIRRLFRELFYKNQFEWDYLFQWCLPNPSNDNQNQLEYIKEEGKLDEQMYIRFNVNPPKPPPSVLDKMNEETPQPKTLLSRIGGVKALSTAVDMFYDSMLSDYRTQHFFKDTNMGHQRQQQKDFLQTALGNQCSDSVYIGKDMFQAHQHLKINDSVYTVTVEILKETLVKCGVDQETLGEIINILESLRNDIVVQKKQTLLDRIGGKPALYKAVDLFYDRMLADDRVKQYFNKTNMVHQRQQQKDFLQTALGGSEDQVYKGSNMYDAHKNLKLNDKAYDATVEILVGVLKELGVDEETLGEIGKIIESLRADIAIVKSDDRNLLEKIGGKEALYKAVDLFYDKMLSDNRVKHYFKNTDMVHQRQQQKDFLQTVLGNQNSDSVYKGKDMFEAHKHLKLDKKAFENTVEILTQALTECGVDQQTLEEIGKIVESTRNDIVAKTLLEKIGGKQALYKAVDMFYDRMLANDKVKDYFKNTNMVHQRQQQKEFLQTVLGNQGTDSIYKGKDMFEAHKNLKINEEAFNITVDILVNVLKDLQVNQQVIDEISPILESLRQDIVSDFGKDVTVLQKIGGKEKLGQIVDLFYDKMLTDDRVKQYFQNTNMVHQRQQQKEFLQTAFGNQGSDNVYKGSDMYQAHKNLKINNKAFDDTAQILAESMVKFGVDKQTLNQIAEIVQSLRDDIVTDKTDQKMTILERIGGIGKLQKIVDIFYDRVAADKRVRPFFKTVQMGHQKQAVTQFLQGVLGDAKDQTYKGKSIFESHKQLQLNNQAFEDLTEIMYRTFRDCGIQQIIIEEIRQMIESLRKDLVLDNSDKKTLLELMGGVKNVNISVDMFYDSMMKDQNLKQYFKNTNMHIQRLQMKDYLKQVLGQNQEEDIYKGKDMYEAHKHLRITEQAFDDTVDQLVIAFDKCGIDKLVIKDIEQLILNLKKDIVAQ